MKTTITVQGYFGDKELTQDEFVTQWVDHVAQLRRLSWTQEWADEVDAILAKVTREARAEFIRLLVLQSPTANGG